MQRKNKLWAILCVVLIISFCITSQVTAESKSDVLEALTTLAEFGDASAQYKLGLMYDFGNGVPQDYRKAAYWYTKAAEQGNAWAQYNLGNEYRKGEGVPKDYKKAFYWFTKAAEQGDAYAQHSLGHMYDFGKGVTQNYKKAFYWYTKAAEQGLVQAQELAAKIQYKIDHQTESFWTDKNGVKHWTDKNSVKHFSNGTVLPKYLQDATQSGEIKYSDGTGGLLDYNKFKEELEQTKGTQYTQQQIFDAIGEHSFDRRTLPVVAPPTKKPDDTLENLVKMNPDRNRKLLEAGIIQLRENRAAGMIRSSVPITVDDLEYLGKMRQSRLKREAREKLFRKAITASKGIGGAIAFVTFLLIVFCFYLVMDNISKKKTKKQRPMPVDSKDNTQFSEKTGNNAQEDFLSRFMQCNTPSIKDLYKAAIGEKNNIYYLSKFEQFDQKGPGLKTSWNWPAFFFSNIWALYRKMYGWFFLSLGVLFISKILEESGSPGWGVIVIIIPCIAFAIFANSLYQNNLTKKIAKAKMTIGDDNKLIEYLRYKGGVHTWVIWIFPGIPVLGILAAILIPMFLVK